VWFPIGSVSLDDVDKEDETGLGGDELGFEELGES